MNRIAAWTLLLAMTLSLLPAAGAAEAAYPHGYLVINNASVNRVVNFRRLPNTNDNSNYPIARLPEYWVVELLSKDNGWYKINANINTAGGPENRQTGYVMESFVRPMTEAQEAAWLQNPTATFRPGTTSAPVSAVTPAPTVPSNPGSGQGYIRVVQQKVNLRKAPGGEVINENNQIALGTVLVYYGVTASGGYDWALVQYGSQWGYIRSDCYMKCDANGNLLTVNTPVPTQAPSAPAFIGIPAVQTYGRVLADNVFFRKAMNTSGDFWARLPAGWMMEVLEVMDPKLHKGITWYKVKGSVPANPSRTYTGYIHGDYFMLISDPASVTPTPVPPAAKNYGLVTMSGVNLRQTEGGMAITALLANTVVNVLSIPADRVNDWYYVELSGMYGYLPGNAMRLLSKEELGQFVLPSPPAGSPTEAPAGEIGHVKLTKDKVNIRKEPAGTVLTAKEKDKLPIGTVLAYTAGPVSGGGYQWVRVTYQGITGYVRGDCFTYCDAGGNPINPPVSTPTPGIVLPTAIPGFPTPEPTDSPSVNQGYVKLIKGGVNLRHSIWGRSLGQLDRGTILPYFNIAKNPSNATEMWYEVYSSKLGSFGFVLATMAELCDQNGNATAPGSLPVDSPAAIVGYVATTASSVWVRKTPAAGADTAGQVKSKGTVLPMIGVPVMTDYTWYPVQLTDGTRGYVRGDFAFELAQWQIDLYKNTGALATPTPGPATPRPGNSSYLQVTGGTLWVRQTPSKKADTVGQLADKAVVMFTSKQVVSNVTWYQVSVNGKNGWVMSNYVRVLTNAEYDAIRGTATPVPAQTLPPTLDPSQFSDMAMTTTARVRIRANANMTGKELYMVYTAGTTGTYLGNYTVPTATNPHYWFYVKFQGVTGWMCGDYVRILTQAEKAAYQQSGNPDAPQEATYRTLAKNSTGDDVRRLQQKLAELGYLASDQISGTYLTSTENAVIAFQKAKGLTVDGIAGSKTQHALFGTVTPGTSLNPDGSSVTVTLYPVEKIDWYTGGIQKIWSVGTVAIVTDVYTGISFRAQRLYGDNHADIEPLTPDDTAAYCRIFGVNVPQDIEDREQELRSYRRRPLWVTIGGRTFAASLYGIPHNYPGDRIPDNGFMGQVCVHFTNSRTHGSNIVDPDASYNEYFGHQSAIQYAYSHSVSGTK